MTKDMSTSNRDVSEVPVRREDVRLEPTRIGKLSAEHDAEPLRTTPQPNLYPTRDIGYINHR